MRLHRLTVTAFGPFARTEEVDFDELAAAGLYLIHGATGAGKTSVLDAICFALYAAVPGARADSRRSLHSDHAPAGAVPEVVLELTAAGRRLRITRSPEFERPKLRGTGTTGVQAKVVLEELVRGQWVPRATRNDEAALVIHDVVGMGLEQFAKVVLLPQGDFAAFLRASPEQRREVLERLFDTQRFTDIEQWLADRRRAAVAAVADARAELQVALVRVQDVLVGLPASAAAAGAPATGASTTGSSSTGASTVGASGAGPLAAAAAPAGDASRGAAVEGSASEAAGMGWPGWADLGATDVPEAIEQVRAAVAAHAGDALAEADVAQGRHDSAASDLHRARMLVDHQRTAATARGILRALAEGRDAYDEAAAQVAAAERALTVGGHLAALEQAELDLNQALATVATRRRDAADRLPQGTHPDLDAPDGVSGLLALLEARQGPLDELGSCASTVTAQEAEAASHAATATQLEGRVASTLARQTQLAEELEVTEEEHTVAQGRAAAVAGHRSVVTSLVRAATLLGEQDRGRALEARLVADLSDRTAAAAEAEATALSLRLARLHGMAGELARGLVDGDACPVCGACEHPRPAELSASVTPEDIEAAEAAATVAMSARSALQSELASARATQEARGAELLTLLGDREPSRVEPDLARARELLRQAEDAASGLPALAGRLSRLRSERDTLGRKVDEQRQAIAAAVSRAEAARAQAARAAQTLAQGLGEHAALCPCSTGEAVTSNEGAPGNRAGSSDVDSPARDTRAGVVGDHREVVGAHRAATRALRGLADASAALATARRTTDSTQARLDAALAAAGFPDAGAARAAMLPAADLSRMSAQLRSLDTQRDQAEALLAQPDVAAAEQQPAPDLDALVAGAAAAREVATRSRRAQAIAESADRRIHELREEVLAIVARIGPAEAEQAVVQELADCVGGTSGNNTLRMRLSSYLLAARLEEVARLANERLQVMTEGRYSLVYSDALARRGARSGLGLRVVDAWTGVSRETSTLSGGESFMASLALALGLGDAVRAEAGGFDLQTLFVDEGFGTLDDESLEQVMGVLDSLREGGRSVGIVSHVSELRQRIPVQLRVTKTQAGSTIDVISSTVSEVA